MPIEIEMPRLSDTMTQGTVNTWHVKVGDSVSAGQHLADIETDKATMQLESFDDGVVAQLSIGEGDTIDIGKTIIILAEDGESAEDAIKNATGGGSSGDSDKDGGASEAVAGDGEKAVAQPMKAAEMVGAAGAGGASGGASNNEGGRIRVSPLARKLAEEGNLDLGLVSGSGPSGRIIKADVLSAIENGVTQGGGAGRADGFTLQRRVLESKVVPVNNMRQAIARVLSESKTTIPHFQVSVTVDALPLAAVRGQVNLALAEQGIKLSVNDFITKACAVCLTMHPAFNSSWTGTGIAYHGDVNVGIAVALPEEKGGGLVVPTIYHADQKSMQTISSDTKTLAKKARTAGLTIDEMSGGTFTISNLGMFGVDHFTAIINPPQVAILAVGGAISRPVVRDGQVVAGSEMTLTLSADHRVIDGAMAAEFLQSLRGLLENPAALLLQ